MIKECKKCGSKNLYLEPRIAGQDVLTADMVALKCKNCGAWVKWCPKNERQYYINKQIDKWQKLKEYIQKDREWNLQHGKIGSATCQMFILEKMKELESENAEM